jgi:hypothetical protein
LGKIDKHLNRNPQDTDSEELEGCEFIEIKCSYCSKYIVRNKLLHHKKTQCSVTSVPSVVNTATSTNRHMMISFTTTGLCVAVIQYDAQTSVELSLSGRSLMTM